jgi:hypothetical protein
MTPVHQVWPLTYTDPVIKRNLQLLEKAVATSDLRFTYRVLKMSNLRKQLSAEVLLQVVREVYPHNHPSVPGLLSLLDKVCHGFYADAGIIGNGGGYA